MTDIFVKTNLPADDDPRWGIYRKRTLTKAMRIDESFDVLTFEGYVHCQNGWLAVDSRGYPYPIDHEEFDAIYEKA